MSPERPALRWPDYQVKGSVLASKVSAVERLFGRTAKDELIAHFSDRLRFPIIDLLWYPYEQLEALLLEILGLHLDGRLESLSRIGECSAQQLLTTVYWAYARDGDFHGFIRSAPRLHNRFYSQGEMRAEPDETRSQVRVILEGAPYYSRADLHVASGFYVGAAQLLGHERAEYQLEQLDDGALVTIQL